MLGKSSPPECRISERERQGMLPIVQASRIDVLRRHLRKGKIARTVFAPIERFNPVDPVAYVLSGEHLS